MGTNELQRFIDNKSLVALRKFAAAEAQLKELKAKHDAILEQVRQAMVDNGVEKLAGDWGYITLAEKTTYKAKDISLVSSEYTKATLDNDKVKAAVTLRGELPAGVVESKTQYLTKKFKEA